MNSNHLQTKSIILILMVFSMMHFANAQTYRYLRFEITNATGFKIVELDWISGSTSYPTSNMTSDNSAGAITSGTFFNHWHAFNGVVTDADGIWTGNSTGSLTLDLQSNPISPTAFRLQKMGWQTINSFVLSGSNDNSNWTTLHTVAGVGGNWTDQTFTIPAPPFLTVSPTSQNFGASSGNQSFTITSNTSWTVSDNQSWISVSPTSGSNNSTATVTVTQNTGTSSRNGTVTVTGGGINRTISVTQGGATPTLTVSTSLLSFTSSAGNQTFGITSNTSWTVSDNQSWISVSPTSGSNNATPTVTVTQNTGSARSGTVTISGSGINRTINISQNAASSGSNKYEAENASLSGVSLTSSGTGYSGTGYMDGGTLDQDQDKITFAVSAPSAGSYPLIIRFQNTCAPCEKAQYVQVNGGTEVYTTFNNTSAGWQDLNFGNVSLNAGNNTIAIRKAWGWTHIDYITVSGTGTPTNSLEVSPSSLSFSSSSGNQNISITSNVSWSVSDNQSWISFSPSSGSNNGSTSVSVTQNSSSAARNGTVTIAGGGITRTVSIAQSGTVAPPTGEMTAGANFWNIGWEGWQDFFVTGLNWSTTSNPWSPTFISELQEAHIGCLRFMDWNMANDVCVSAWSERIPKTANHYNSGNIHQTYQHNYDGQTNTHSLVPYGSQGYGVAYEWQIDLCNRIDADIWINIPINASDSYVTSLANLLNSQLESSRKIYIEWANETWNTSFSTWVYAYQTAQQLGLDNVNVGAYLDPWRKYTVYRSVQIFKLFENVFGTNNPRLIKVIAGQVGYHWDGYDYNHMAVGDLAAVANSTINPNGIEIDAWAIAPYYNGQSVSAMQTSVTGTQQLALWAKNSLIGTGLSLVCYEGGADNYPDSDLSLTRNSAQEQLYEDYLTGLAQHVDGVFTQYCFYGGPWGIKHAAGESASINPKWRGWINYWDNAFARTGAGIDEPLENEISVNSASMIYPNPIIDGNLNVDLSRIEHFQKTELLIHDLSGKLIRSFEMEGDHFKIHRSELPGPGLFFMRFRAPDSNHSLKFILK